MKRRTSIDVRVRYVECDAMAVAHHSVYPVWFEIARTELLREQGVVYRDLEQAGTLFVVVRMNVRYRRPAKYDDLLSVQATAQPIAGVKVEHHYEIHRGRELLATGQTTLACVDAQGKLRPVPEALRA